MTRQEIYEQVVQLTSEVHAVGVAEKIFAAASTGEARNVDEAYKSFIKENPELYKRIVSFGKKFNKFIKESKYRGEGEIFRDREEKENWIFIFDPNAINSLSLYALTFFADIEDIYLFEWGSTSSENFMRSIADAGYKKLANFINGNTWKYLSGEDHYDNLSELLVAIFNGKFGELEE